MLSDSLSAYVGLIAKDMVRYEKDGEDYDPEMLNQIRSRLFDLYLIGHLLDAGYGDWEEMEPILNQEISDEQIKLEIERVAGFREEGDETNVE